MGMAERACWRIVVHEHVAAPSRTMGAATAGPRSGTVLAARYPTRGVAEAWAAALRSTLGRGCRLSVVQTSVAESSTRGTWDEQRDQWAAFEDLLGRWNEKADSVDATLARFRERAPLQVVGQLGRAIDEAVVVLGELRVAASQIARGGQQQDSADG
jgi:hypothetical protein